MVKPATFDGYSDQYAVECERILVTLLRGPSPWTESVFLVGGLTPRYLVAARPPELPAHAGTLDVDIVAAIRSFGRILTVRHFSFPSRFILKFLLPCSAEAERLSAAGCDKRSGSSPHFWNADEFRTMRRKRFYQKHSGAGFR